jgi:hypothetical protein
MAEPESALKTSGAREGTKRGHALKRARELHRRIREDFSKAHRAGMAALERHDYRGLTDAIEAEASAIAAHVAALQQLNETIKSRVK